MPPVHGTMQTRSFVATHADLAPEPPHAEAAVHAVHGSMPDAENVLPATQGTWHTVFAFLVQAVLTPTAPHAWQPPHGALPDADHVEPATQVAVLQTVSAVLVQAVLTPTAPHVLHAPHGVMPDADHVLPALQAAGAHLQVAEGQNGGLWLQFELQ